LEQQGVELKTEPAKDVSAWWEVLVGFLPLLLFIGLGYLIYRGMQAQGKNLFFIAKSRARLCERRKEKTTIGQADIEEARDKILLGLERENLGLTDEECRLLAYHEAGHAAVAAMLPHADPIHKVTIVPRGRSMGVMQQMPEREKYIYARDYMLDRLAVMMGGRAAETLVLKTSTSGAETDVKQATMMARKMILDWGMSDKFAHIALADQPEHVFLGQEIAQRREFSEKTAWEIDGEIQKILDEAFQRAVEILKEKHQGLDRLAQALLDREEITGKEAIGLLGVEQSGAAAAGIG
jgi:cell division protease FtsH